MHRGQYRAWSVACWMPATSSCPFRPSKSTSWHGPMIFSVRSVRKRWLIRFKLQLSWSPRGLRQRSCSKVRGTFGRPTKKWSTGADTFLRNCSCALLPVVLEPLLCSPAERLLGWMESTFLSRWFNTFGHHFHSHHSYSANETCVASQRTLSTSAQKLDLRLCCVRIFASKASGGSSGMGPAHLSAIARSRDQYRAPWR